MSSEPGEEPEAAAAWNVDGDQWVEVQFGLRDTQSGKARWFNGGAKHKPNAWKQQGEHEGWIIRYRLLAAAPAPSAASDGEAYPKTIGRRHLGGSRSDGDRLCNEGHDVPAGHPLYWYEPMGQYDDSDPCCLEHAIDQYARETGDGASATPDAAIFREAIEAAAKVAEDEIERLGESLEAATDDIDRMRIGNRYQTAQAIHAAIRALSEGEPSGWREIESAPKDGRYFLAIVATNRGRYLEHHAGRMFAIRHEGKTPSGFDLGWAVYPGFGGASDHDFSHWMPLPTPPASQGERGGVEG
jgi:hypothetical protein